MNEDIETILGDLKKKCISIWLIINDDKYALKLSKNNTFSTTVVGKTLEEAINQAVDKSKDWPLRSTDGDVEAPHPRGKGNHLS